MITIVGRHIICDIVHYIIFFIHDLVLPFAIIIPFLQIFIQKNWHKKNGKFFLHYIFPIVNITGAILTLYSFLGEKRIIPLSSIFLSYGSSYYIFGSSLIQRYYYAHYLCLFLYIHTLYQLSFLKFYQWIELMILFFPIPILHILNMKYYHHEFVGKCFIYLSLLGTFFTLSYDQYWIFSSLLELRYRVLIQNIPLLLLFLQLSKSVQS
jgi:hypothetical protein